MNKKGDSNSKKEDENNIKKLEEIIESNIEKAKDLKKFGKSHIELGKNVVHSSDQAIRNYSKTKKILNNIETKSSSLPAHIDEWFQEKTEREKIIGESMEKLTDSMEERKNDSIELTASGVSISASTDGTITTIGNLVADSKFFDDRTKEKVEDIRDRDNLNNKTEAIKEYFSSNCPRVEREFREAVKRWTSATSNEEKKSVLQSFRRIIYFEFLKEIAPQSEYSKSPWFSQTTKKFNEDLKEKGVDGVQRAYQSKYMIMGNEDENNISTPLLDRIDKQSKMMQIIYDNLSDLEHGNYDELNYDEWKLENLYTDTITTLADIINLHKIHSHP